MYYPTWIDHAAPYAWVTVGAIAWLACTFIVQHHVRGVRNLSWGLKAMLVFGGPLSIIGYVGYHYTVERPRARARR